jgi:hypothetical protein
MCDLALKEPEMAGFLMFSWPVPQINHALPDDNA